MKPQANSVIGLTRRLIDRLGPRPPGSRESRDCADALADDIRSRADDVWTEDFSFSPGAFLGWIRILVVAYLLAVIGLWIGWFLASALLLIAAVGLLVFQFFLYREVLDPFFPRATGRNVFATLEPEEELRGELIISGHHDSANVFNFLVHQPGLYGLRVTGSIASLLALAFTGILLAILQALGASLGWSWIPAAVFTVLLLLVLQLWFFRSPKYTPGAGDNLASTSVAWEFLKYRADEKGAGRGFRHLRILAVSWDAEEAGLRGSRAWRRARVKKPGNHPSWNLNLECLFDADEMFLMTSDINGSVDLSLSLAQRCSRIMSETCGRGVPTRPIAFLTGGTDAGETARAGVEATTLMGMPWQNDVRSAVYHTPNDTVESISLDAVDAALALVEGLAGELDDELTGAES